MQSRHKKIIKSALVGGLIGGGVGYLFCDERVYRIIPEYFSHAARKSADRFGERITRASDDMADKIPLVGTFVKTLTVSNPLLTSLTYKVTDLVIDAAKKSMMKACAKAMQPHKVVPIMCLAGMAFGAGVAALAEWMSAPDDDQPAAKSAPQLSEREQFKLSMLRSQSIFNRRLAKLDNQVALKTLHTSL
jgi:hypothetical protein